MNFGTPQRGTQRLDLSSTPSFFGRSGPSEESPPGKADFGRRIGVGESMFAHGFRSRDAVAEGTSFPVSASKNTRSGAFMMAQTPHSETTRLRQEFGGVAKEDFGVLASNSERNSNFQEISMVPSGSSHSGMIVKGNGDEDDDDDLMPPSNSLLAGRSRGETPRLGKTDSFDGEMEVDGPRRRKPLGGSERQGGVDIGAPRGLDLMASTRALNSQYSDENADLGVTAAVQLIAVKTPWVTVFGYPAGAGFAVLRHFQKFGEVHEHRNESGNWMHILYSSKVQASRALAQNGQFISIGDSKVMIGVKASSDPSLANIPVPPQREKQRSFQMQQNMSSKAQSACKRFFAWLLDV